MTRLKERLDRRVARMSDDAKITQEMAILFAAVFVGVAPGAAAVFMGIGGYLIGLWWWWLAILGGLVCLAAGFAGVRLAFYVGRDVLHTWSWDWW